MAFTRAQLAALDAAKILGVRSSPYRHTAILMA
jgi:hypothetical protein